MARYATDTAVPVDRSRAELENVLRKYGASRFGYMSEDGRVVVMFDAENRRVRFDLPLPSVTDPEFALTPGRQLQRSESQILALWEQACRQRWRALNLVVKAKLEAVECGISTFEEEFLANICLPDGSTVGEWVAPQIEKSYSSGTMPPMLALGK